MYRIRWKHAKWLLFLTAELVVQRFTWGPSIKYVTLEGVGVREGVQFVTGGVEVKSMWRHTYKFFIIHMKHEIQSDVTDVFWQKGEWTKTTRDKTFQTKDPLPWQNPWTKIPAWTIETEFVQEDFVRVFCTRPTKRQGVQDVWRTFGGVKGCVTRCDRGEGSQNWPKIAWCTLWTAPCNRNHDCKFKISSVTWKSSARHQLIHACWVKCDGVRCPEISNSDPSPVAIETRERHPQTQGSPTLKWTSHSI